MVRVSTRPDDERLPQALLSRLLRAVPAGRELAIAPGIRQELAHLLPDDLQFADDASLETAQHIAARAGLRWFVAFRDVEPGEAARRFVAALSKSMQQHRVALLPLGRDDVHSLVASLGVAEIDADILADVLHRRTGGNPLFLLETIKAFPVRPATEAGLPAAAHVVHGPASLIGLPAPSNVGELGHVDADRIISAPRGAQRRRRLMRRGAAARCERRRRAQPAAAHRSPAPAPQ